MTFSHRDAGGSRRRLLPRGRTPKVLAVGVAAVAIGVAVTQYSASAYTVEQGPNYVKVRSNDFKYDKDRKGYMSGWLQVIMYDSGNYNLAWHAHNGTVWSKDYSIACVITSSSGGVHPFVAKGDLKGTGAAAVRGGSKTDDAARNGNDAGIKDDWQYLRAGVTANCNMRSSFDSVGLLKDMHGIGEEGLNVYKVVEEIW